MKLMISPKIVNKRFRMLFNKTQRYQVVFGGSSSSKSYSVFSMVPLWMMEGRSILGIRENDAHIKKSIWLEVTKAIYRLELSEYFTINKSDKTIVCKVSDGCFVTSGVLDVEKLKSVVPIKGDCFDTVIIEEATEIKSAETINQILLRQRGESDFPLRAFFLFNPINKTHHLYDRFFKDLEEEYNFNDGRECLYYEDERLLIHKSTYVDNKYVGESVVQEFEDLKVNSPEQHRIYANGDFGVFGSIIYDNNVTYVNALPDSINGLPWRIGMDHGFNDYQTLCITKWDEKNNIVYVIDTIQQKNMLPKEFSVLVKNMFKLYNIPESIQIIADSSSPTNNALFCQYGLNVRRTVKGAGSKLVGLLWMKTKRIIIPKHLTDMKESISIYTWKKDKAGNSTEDTNHEGSDLLDALRYAYELHFIGYQGTFGAHRKN